VWYDLMTNDPKKVEPFYQKVAGWGTQVWNGQQPYTTWTAGGKPIGGVMDMPAPSTWLQYVLVDSADRAPSV
jgi:predicted enzyme related to lactoylglutathione lyase